MTMRPTAEAAVGINTPFVPVKVVPLIVVAEVIEPVPVVVIFPVVVIPPVPDEIEPVDPVEILPVVVLILPIAEKAPEIVSPAVPPPELVTVRVVLAALDRSKVSPVVPVRLMVFAVRLRVPEAEVRLRLPEPVVCSVRSVLMADCIVTAPEPV